MPCTRLTRALHRLWCLAWRRSTCEGSACPGGRQTPSLASGLVHRDDSRTDSRCRTAPRQHRTYPTPTATTSALAAEPWVEKVESSGAGSCNFPTDSCTFPTKGIMGDQNFNFAPKFLQKWTSFSPNLAFLAKKFRTKKLGNSFPTTQNLGRGQLINRKNWIYIADSRKKISNASRTLNHAAIKVKTKQEAADLIIKVKQVRVKLTTIGFGVRNKLTDIPVPARWQRVTNNSTWRHDQ